MDVMPTMRAAWSPPYSSLPVRAALPTAVAVVILGDSVEYELAKESDKFQNSMGEKGRRGMKWTG